MTNGLEALQKIKEDFGCDPEYSGLGNDFTTIEKELKQHEKLKSFIYKEKEKIDKQIEKLGPDYNETISDLARHIFICEACEKWSRLFAKQELLDKIIKEVFENEQSIRSI